MPSGMVLGGGTVEWWLGLKAEPLCMGLCLLVIESCPALCNPVDCSPKGFSVRGILQEYWSGLHCLLPGDLPNPGTTPGSSALQVDSLPSEPQGFSSVQFSHSVVSDSLWPHGLQHARTPCPSPAPEVYQNSYPLSRWWHPTISFSVVPFFSHL